MELKHFTRAASLFTAVAIAASLSAADKDAKTSLTLMTYNIHVAVPMGKDIGKDFSGKTELDNVSEVIMAAKPDIVALQEIEAEYGFTLPPERKRSSEVNQPRYLAHKTQMSYIFGSCIDDTRTFNPEYVEWGTADHWKNNGKRHGEAGNALLLKSKFVEPPSSGPLPYGEKEVQRAYVRAEIPESEFGHKIVVYGTHFHHVNPPTRLRQMQELLKVAKPDMEDNIVFIMGDLNHKIDNDDSTTNPIRVALDAGFHDLHKDFADAAGTPADKTCCRRPQNSRIDYVLSSRPLKVLHAEVPQSDASDHYPVVVSVELP